MTYPFSAWQVYKRLLRYLRPLWLMFLLGVLGNVGFSLTDASLIGLIKPLLDEGFIARNKDVFRLLPFVVIGFAVLRGLVSFVAEYCMSYVGRKIVMEMRRQLFSHLLCLPTTYYDSNPSGELLSKLTYNTDQVASACADSVKTVVKEGTMVVALLGVMFYHSFKLSLLFLIAGPLIYVTVRYASARFRRLSRKIQESIGSISHAAEEVFQGNKVVKIFSGQSVELSKFNERVTLNFKQEMKMTATKAMSSPVVQIAVVFVLAAIIYFASLQSMAETISAGTFVSMLAAMLAIMRPIKQLTDVSNTVQRGIAGAESIFQILDEKAEMDRGKHFIHRSKGSIRFQNVSFRYQDEAPYALDRISLDIRPGEVIALVGHSGGGKTTLVNLLPRFYQGYEGLITLDGIDIRNFKLSSLRQQIALVSQQVVLFNDTIAHNIAYAQPERTRAQIERAAKQAHILEFAGSLEKGLDTFIGENGVKLSGGQRQRIAIARALLKDAPILILDEATSALDTESERYIQAVLASLMQSRTTLVIAHRLSTIEGADQIVVLERGRVLEKGTHRELFEQDGQYAKLYRMQFATAFCQP